MLFNLNLYIKGFLTMRTSIKTLSILLSTLSLVACGSGSSGNNGAPTPTTSLYQYPTQLHITSDCTQGSADNETVANLTWQLSDVTPSAHFQISQATPVDPAITLTSQGNCSSDNESSTISCTYTFKFNSKSVPISNVAFDVKWSDMAAGT